MNHFEILEVKQLFVELSSHCNAGCPMCTRHISGTNQLRDTVVLSSIRLPQWQKVLDQLQQTYLDIQFSGCLGDPCMSPDFFEIVRATHDRGYGYQVVTNGSIGAPKKWAELGKIARDDRHEVHFSIDGLEDTNHLYRIGIEWKKIMANAKAFLDAGGYAVWKFIIFEHNEHQVEEARALAKEMGFAKFETVITTRNQLRFKDKKVKVEAQTKKKQDLIPMINAVDKSDELFQKNYVENLNKDVVCDAKKKSRLYIDSQFNLWPCMYLGTGGSTFKGFYDIIPSEDNWNSLDHHEMDEILDHEFIRGLDEGNWCSMCYKQCSGAAHRKMVDGSYV